MSRRSLALLVLLVAAPAAATTLVPMTDADLVRTSAVVVVGTVRRIETQALRSGRLVEVATLADLRRLHTTIVEVLVDGPPPSLEDVDGVTACESIAGGVRVSLVGSPAALLQRLATLPVTSLRTEEATLEQVFLTYY